MTWTKNSFIIGNVTCTQFQNSGPDELNPQTAYQTTPFINSNTTTSQDITFNYFDSLTKTDSVNTKVLSATASSGLTVTLTSLDTNIATITGGNTLNAINAGKVYIQATQAGNGTYDPATPIICVFTITLSKTQVGPNSYIQFPTTITTTSTKPYLKQMTIALNDIRYTQYSGISYGYATGFHGAAAVGSISAIDKDDNPITDFTSDPISVSVNMAQANTSHVYKIYKRSGTTVIDPQPTGYPVTLTYVSGTTWTGTMTSLSDIVILDETPPAGNAGGDPYIISVKKIKTLLPNSWKRISLLKSNTLDIIANCEFLPKEITSQLHYINKNKNVCMPIDPDKHKWVRDLTYITTIEFIKNNEKLIIDTITGQIVYDNSNILYEKINSKYGLFSITHQGYYPHVSFRKYVFYIDGGSVALSIDNYWDDVNYIELFLDDNNYDSYTGELIEHNVNNALLIDTDDRTDISAADMSDVIKSITA